MIADVEVPYLRDAIRNGLIREMIDSYRSHRTYLYTFFVEALPRCEQATYGILFWHRVLVDEQDEVETSLLKVAYSYVLRFCYAVITAQRDVFYICLSFEHSFCGAIV